MEERKILNHAALITGGIRVESVSDCVLDGLQITNSAGDALSVTNAEVLVDKCVISDCAGHGLWAFGSSLRVANSVIENASQYGVLTQESTVNLVHATVIDNVSGVVIGGQADQSIVNSIIWGNGGALSFDGGSASDRIVRYNDVQGDWQDYDETGLGAWPWSANEDSIGNICADPDIGSVTRWEPQSGSAVIDAASPAGYFADLYDRVRPAGDATDMGACEFQ